MNILIVGLGVIGSTYGYLFQKAGHHTEHLIRENSSKNNIHELQIDMLDGRTLATGEWKKDKYDIQHTIDDMTYDLIFVSVPAGGIAEVLISLKEKNIHGTILLACGIWYDKKQLNEVMRNWDYLLGYPVAGGNMNIGILNCCVFDHFMLEREENTTVKNYKEIKSLFNDCEVKLETPYDMLEWIWLHMAINAGVITVAGKYGNIHDTSASAEKLMDSSKALSEAVISIRETTKIIKARGVNLNNYRNELFAYKIPAGIASIVMKKMFAKNILTRKIMTLHNNVNDLLYVCNNVYACGKEHSVVAPVFYANYKIIGLPADKPITE